MKLEIMFVYIVRNVIFLRLGQIWGIGVLRDNGTELPELFQENGNE